MIYRWNLPRSKASRALQRRIQIAAAAERTRRKPQKPCDHIIIIQDSGIYRVANCRATGSANRPLATNLRVLAGARLCSKFSPTARSVGAGAALPSYVSIVQ